MRAAAPRGDVPGAATRHRTGPFDDVITLGIRSAGHDPARGRFSGLPRCDGDRRRRAARRAGRDRCRPDPLPLHGVCRDERRRCRPPHTAKRRNRAEIRPGGVTVVVGAAGPMGQMHIERALRMADGPRLVLGVDLDQIASGRTRQARAGGRRARARAGPVGRSAPSPMPSDPVAGDRGPGADDIVVTAPVAARCATPRRR